MSRSTFRTRRTVLTVLAVALSGAVAPVIAAGSAEAAGGGKVCLILAPNSVDLDGRLPARPVGHIGWAFRSARLPDPKPAGISLFPEPLLQQPPAEGRLERHRQPVTAPNRAFGNDPATTRFTNETRTDHV
ncbi:hypothetical protein ACWGB8_12900 [Kitasatospora sp. NPDC054939]